MTSAERFLGGFAQTWRDKQQRLWDEFSHDDRAAYVEALERAWHDACRQWWNNLRHVVPASLANQLEAALRQTQLCVSLALRAEHISATDLALLMNPAAGLHAAMQEQLQHKPRHMTPAERAELLAGQALSARTAGIAQDALTAVREQLFVAHERKPRELYTSCAHIIEAVYREQAGSDEFARLIGQWVNAHVAVLAERRDATMSSSDSTLDRAAERRSVFPAAPPGHPFADASELNPATTFSQTDPLIDQATQQMREFADKLAAGASSLAALPAGASHGVSAHEVVFQCDGVKLLRYRDVSQQVTSRPDGTSTLPPLLVVYSLVNRPYILDLDEERSFVRRLCDAGRDVYLIDWGYPREQDASLSLHDYINRYLHGCVTYLQTVSDATRIDVIGICQGGPLALCYAALEPERIRRLALLAAPVDFHTNDFLLSQWMRHVDVDALVKTLGNVPGHLLNWSFIALKPVSLSGMKALELLDLLDCPGDLATYAQMEHWLQDNPDQAGKAFAEFARVFVRENGLVNATAHIGTRSVNLQAVRHRVLNVYASRDHIVPPSASRPLPELLTNAQCTNVQVECGHIGVFAGRRHQSKVPQLVNEWFESPDYD